MKNLTEEEENYMSEGTYYPSKSPAHELILRGLRKHWQETHGGKYPNAIYVSRSIFLALGCVIPIPEDTNYTFEGIPLLIDTNDPEEESLSVVLV
ncbi:MAG: hypothetical protein ACXABY_03145 [Candidatus Thorarchaeota archaeon]|jgi:hypothetical protein